MIVHDPLAAGEESITDPRRLRRDRDVVVPEAVEEAFDVHG